MPLAFLKRNKKMGENGVAIPKYPFYLHATIILAGLFFLFYALHILADILIPLAFALLLAILLNPLCNWLQSRKIPKAISILLSLLLAFLIVGGIVYFVITQLAHFTEMMPTLKVKATEIYNQIQWWIATHLKYSVYKQNVLIKKAMDNSEALVSTLNSLFGIISLVLLIPTYTYLFLYYKPLLLNFFYEAFDDKSGDKVEEVLAETKVAIQSYVVGLLLETLIIAALNSTALLILGVDYAIMLGAIGALLNMIPYIGGLVAIALPVIMATITKDGVNTQFMIIIAYTVIQFVDNNIIVPRVVSSKVSVNALISIVIVLLGNALWGVSGMFLSIPFIGVLKIIFDRVEVLQPWGKLLGDKMPTAEDAISSRSHTIILEDGPEEAPKSEPTTQPVETILEQKNE